MKVKSLFAFVMSISSNAFALTDISKKIDNRDLNNFESTEYKIGKPENNFFIIDPSLDLNRYIKTEKYDVYENKNQNKIYDYDYDHLVDKNMSVNFSMQEATKGLFIFISNYFIEDLLPKNWIVTIDYDLTKLTSDETHDERFSLKLIKKI